MRRFRLDLFAQSLSTCSCVAHGNQSVQEPQPSSSSVVLGRTRHCCCGGIIVCVSSRLHRLLFLLCVRDCVGVVSAANRKAPSLAQAHTHTPRSTLYCCCAYRQSDDEIEMSLFPSDPSRCTFVYHLCQNCWVVKFPQGHDRNVHGIRRRRQKVPTIKSQGVRF